MSYNTYNTRNSGRYNTPGRFVSGGEQYRQNQRQYQQPTGQTAPQAEPQPQPQQPQQPQPPQPQLSSPPPPPPSLQMDEQNNTLQNADIEMKAEKPDPVVKESEPHRPYWMKTKLSGVKKISNKERRRRQNENLRKLLAPKNALMVLNEMMPGEREVAQFKVEPAPPHPYYNAASSHSFCAELTVDGVDYKGYGENKLAARSDAAEQAIRDLIIKRMNKVHSEVNSGVPAPEAGEGGEDEQALPMIQLASFALHKLFAEWEGDGHKVPHLKALAPPLMSDNMSEASAHSGGGGAGGAAGGGAGRAGGRRGGGAGRPLPANAGDMHPCMLLTYMRPHLEYRELAVDGDRPQNMLFTMGIEVDGTTYVGKAANKREARKQAARAACEAVFGVTFSEAPTATAPVKPQQV